MIFLYYDEDFTSIFLKGGNCNKEMKRNSVLILRSGRNEEEVFDGWKK